MKRKKLWTVIFWSTQLNKFWGEKSYGMSSADICKSVGADNLFKNSIISIKMAAVADGFECI